jgi:hypothetical protein
MSSSSPRRIRKKDGRIERLFGRYGGKLKTADVEVTLADQGLTLHEMRAII